MKFAAVLAGLVIVLSSPDVHSQEVGSCCVPTIHRNIQYRPMIRRPILRSRNRLAPRGCHLRVRFIEPCGCGSGTGRVDSAPAPEEQPIQSYGGIVGRPSPAVRLPRIPMERNESTETVSRPTPICPDEFLFQLGNLYIYSKIDCASNSTVPGLIAYLAQIHTGCDGNGGCNTSEPSVEFDKLLKFIQKADGTIDMAKVEALNRTFAATGSFGGIRNRDRGTSD